ncbi:MAG TPA: hypothetical protein VF039_10175 [Longimicrobiales bacterium]
MSANPKAGKPRVRDEDAFEVVTRTTLIVFVVVAILSLIYLPLPLAILAMAIPLVMPIVQLVGGRAARVVYDPKGAGVPSRAGYSAAESLAVRGLFEDAINAYELAAADEPADPEPLLRIARIERSDLKRPQRAIEALRAARARVAPDSQTALMIAREIADTFHRDLNEPARAMPELARLAADFADTPTGAWAKRELAELKARLEQERTDG